MKLTRGLAKAIVDVIAIDKEAQRRIDSALAYIIPDSFGGAGGVRNFGFALIETYTGNGQPTKEQDSLVCYGIAEYTYELINKAIAKSKQESMLRTIKKASYINRDLYNIAHQATLITFQDGTEVVFDWHATLNSKNPLIYPSPEDFRKGTNSVTFDNFTEFNDQGNKK